MEMNFCRRCGAQLNNIEKHIYKCANGHTIYANASPAVGVLFINDKKQVLMAVRSIDPGKGKFDMPGGFCDEGETYDLAITREMEEELGIKEADYSQPEFLLSYIDPYDYQGETQSVLCGVYTARLNDGVVPQPADDVAEVMYMAYDDIDQSRIQFPSQKAGLKRLRELGFL